MSMVLSYTRRYIAVWLWKQLGEGQTIGRGTYQATDIKGRATRRNDNHHDGVNVRGKWTTTYAQGRHVHLVVRFVFFRAFNCYSVFPHDVFFNFVISFSVPYVVYLKTSYQDIARWPLSLNCIQSSFFKIHCPLGLIEINNATTQARNPH